MSVTRQGPRQGSRNFSVSTSYNNSHIEDNRRGSPGIPARLEGWALHPVITFARWRYTGIELATEMHNTGVSTLEEFFGLPAAPSYG